MGFEDNVVIDSSNIANVGDIIYKKDGSFDLFDIQLLSGWYVVSQELWLMMISDETSLGTDGDLAINIRQFIEYPPNAETAGLIEDYIYEKISAHPMLGDLGLTLETYPEDGDKLRIVFKRPSDASGLSDKVEDLDFSVNLDIKNGTVSGLLDDNSTPMIAYSTSPIDVHEQRKIQKASNTIQLDYKPVEYESILVYNINDINIVDGEIQTDILNGSASIVLRKGTIANLYDYFDDNLLDNRLIKEAHLYDASGNEISSDKYSILNYNLVPSYTNFENGTYTLEIITEKVYAYSLKTNETKRDTNLSIYPFLRQYVYNVNLNRQLTPGDYIIKYKVYSG